MKRLKLFFKRLIFWKKKPTIVDFVSEMNPKFDPSREKIDSCLPIIITMTNPSSEDKENVPVFDFFAETTDVQYTSDDGVLAYREIMAMLINDSVDIVMMYALSANTRQPFVNYDFITKSVGKQIENTISGTLDAYQMQANIAMVNYSFKLGHKNMEQHSITVGKLLANSSLTLRFYPKVNQT